MVKKCPNCNHYISDTVTVCPHCGKEFLSSSESSLDTKDINSEILAKICKRGNGYMLISMLENTCVCTIKNDAIQISIASSRKDDGDLKFNTAEDAYKKLKSSNYISDFIVDYDSYKDGSIEFIINEFSKDGKLRILDVNKYFVELIQNVFGITSPNQFYIDEIEKRNYNQEIEPDQTVSDSSDDGIYEVEDDSAGTWMNVLCFLIPIVGLILYFVKKNEYPNKAKSYLTWAAVGFGVTLLLNIIL